MRADLSKIAFSLAAAFVLPALAYVLGVGWNKVVGSALREGTDSRIEKTWITFCLLGPIFCIGMIVNYGFESLNTVWHDSPILASILYFFFGAIVPVGLIIVIVRMWRDAKGK